MDFLLEKSIADLLQKSKERSLDCCCGFSLCMQRISPVFGADWPHSMSSRNGFYKETASISDMALIVSVMQISNLRQNQRENPPGDLRIY